MNNNLIYNPFNIRTNTQKFQGEVQPSSNPAFKQFESFPYGIRAGCKILVTYYAKYGLNTIHELIQRWAPPSDGNDTPAYEEFVSKHMGISIYEAFKVTDYNEMMLLADAIGHRENPVAYTPDDLELGVSMALNLKTSVAKPTA